MTFEEIKQNIQLMEHNPNIILNKMQTSCHVWQYSISKIMAFVEEHIKEEKFAILKSPLTEEMTQALYIGSMILPAIMLTETDDKSWEVYSSIILLCQIYSGFVNDEKLLEITRTLETLTQAKDSWKALLIQCESLIVQSQSMVNASILPYNLSKRFLTSLIDKEGL